MNGSVMQINESMRRVFGADSVLCYDGLRMNFMYLLKEPSIIDFIRELNSRDLLPRPIGIGVVVRRNDNPAFGFGSNNTNFNNGNFYGGDL